MEEELAEMLSKHAACMRISAGVVECSCERSYGLASIISATFRNLWPAVSKYQATMFGVVKGRKDVTRTKCL